MKDYKRLTSKDDSLCIDCEGIGFCRKTCIRQARYERLQFLENEIENGEIDYVTTVKPEQTIIDLITEFDEMSFAPTTLCPDPEQFAIDWRDQVRKEFARLTAENAALKARLEKAVELPYIEKCKEYTKIVYKNEFGDIDDETYFHDCYYSYKNDIRGDKYAEARLAELKGGKE